MDILSYGDARATALLYPGRRVIKGRVLALEGISGIAVGDGTLMLDDDTVRLLIGQSRALHEIPYEEVTSLQVAGRGELVIESGGGWVGGGFGLSGALKGAFMASALNALTTITRRTVETLVHVEWSGGAITLLTTTFTPEQMAALVDPTVKRLQALHGADSKGEGDVSRAEHTALAALSSAPQESVAARLQKLESLREAGLISADEYVTQRSRILSEI